MWMLRMPCYATTVREALGREQTMWPAITSFLFGAVGWFSVKFFFEPWSEIAVHRREAQECLIVYADLSPSASIEQRKAAAEAFRRIGAGLVSRHIAAHWWVRKYSCWRGDIHSAGLLLIGIGNDVQQNGLSNLHALPIVELIRKSLWLRSPGKPPLIGELMDMAGAPAPISNLNP